MKSRNRRRLAFRTAGVLFGVFLVEGLYLFDAHSYEVESATTASFRVSASVMGTEKTGRWSASSGPPFELWVWVHGLQDDWEARIVEIELPTGLVGAPGLSFPLERRGSYHFVKVPELELPPSDHVIVGKVQVEDTPGIEFRLEVQYERRRTLHHRFFSRLWSV